MKDHDADALRGRWTDAPVAETGRQRRRFLIEDTEPGESATYNHVRGKLVVVSPWWDPRIIFELRVEGTAADPIEARQ